VVVVRAAQKIPATPTDVTRALARASDLTPRARALAQVPARAPHPTHREHGVRLVPMPMIPGEGSGESTDPTVH
jgi:hypothetical protein